MRSDGIEIPQQHRRKGGIGMTGILQNLFDHGLGGAVGAGALSARHILPVRDGIARAVNGSGGREDKPADTGLLHTLQYRQGGIEIGTVVGKGNFDRLPHGLFPGKVNDTVDFILTEDAADGFAVGYIDMVGRKIPAGDLPEALHCHGAAIGIIIRYDNITTPVQQLYCGVATDIAGPAGQQYIHGFTLPSFLA